MDAQSATHQRRRRGFNLIESAIVLGVVGLVIGGVWVAASAVTEQMRISRTVNATLETIENVRAINGNFTPNQLAGSSAVGFTVSILTSMYDAGAIPKDVYPVCHSMSNSCDGLWGYNKSGTRLFVIKDATGPGRYYLQAWADVKFCIEMGMRYTSIDWKEQRIEHVIIGQNHVYSPENITLDYVTNRCNISAGSAIYFYP